MKRRMLLNPNTLIFVVSMLGIGLPALSMAQDAQSTGPTQQGTPPGSMSGANVIDGEVRKIDKAAKKITLRHGEMPHLEMPAMTMVFQVKDPALLDSVKVGDKVKFKAEKIGGAFVVVDVQPAR